MTSPRIFELPDELLLQIAGNFSGTWDGQSTLCALSRVSRRWQPVAQEALCVTPILREDEGIHQLLKFLISNPEFANKVTGLRFCFGPRFSDMMRDEYRESVKLDLGPLLASHPDSPRSLMDAYSKLKTGISNNRVNSCDILIWTAALIQSTPNLRFFETSNNESWSLPLAMDTILGDSELEKLLSNIDTFVLLEEDNEFWKLARECDAKIQPPPEIVIVGTAANEDSTAAEKLYRENSPVKQSVRYSFPVKTKIYTFDELHKVEDLEYDDTLEHLVVFANHVHYNDVIASLNTKPTVRSHGGINALYPSLVSLTIFHNYEVTPYTYFQRMRQGLWLAPAFLEDVHVKIFKSSDAHARYSQNQDFTVPTIGGKVRAMPLHFHDRYEDIIPSLGACQCRGCWEQRAEDESKADNDELDLDDLWI